LLKFSVLKKMHPSKLENQRVQVKKVMLLCLIFIPSSLYDRPPLKKMNAHI
jgi:hypothetical protein